MTEIPSCFIADTERAFQLIGRHALSGLYQEEHGKEPCFQGQMGIVEDCVCCNTELIMTFCAFVFLLCGHLKNLLAFATRAFYVFRPTKSFKEFAASFIGRIKMINIEECHG